MMLKAIVCDVNETLFSLEAKTEGSGPGSQQRARGILVLHSTIEL